jgi:membrane protein YqaA with SNARE-associated domain
VGEVEAYVVVAAAVFAVNLLPAFGPPTWAVLVLFTVNGDYVTWLLVLVGALAAASGRLVLAHATRRLGRYLPERRRANLKAAGDLLAQRRGRSIAFLALFAVSPVPSAQLFEAAGLMSLRLLPLTGAFFVGRTVSYAVYATGAEAASDTDTGQVLLSSLTSWWGVALQVAMLAGIVLLARVDWVRLLTRRGDGSQGGPAHRDPA